MIFFAFTFPMPLSSKSSFEVALFISTTANKCVRVKSSMVIALKMVFPSILYNNLQSYSLNFLSALMILYFLVIA